MIWLYCCVTVEAMEMIADGRVDIGPLITHTFSSTEFPKAYDTASNYRDGIIKTMIVWNDQGVDAPNLNAGLFTSSGVSPAGAAAAGQAQCILCSHQPTKL